MPTIPQVTVGTTGPAIGFPGMLSDASFKDNTSAVNSEATAEMRFGIMVGTGATAAECLLLAANDDVLKGIVVYHGAYSKDLELGDTGLKPLAEVALLQHRRIWVLVEGALPVEGDPVHVRAVAAGAEVAGAFLKAADGTDTINISTMAHWTGRTGTACAEIDIDLTGRQSATHA